MTEKEKEDSDIFTGFDFGSMTVDITADVNNPTFTWDIGSTDCIYT